MKKKSNSNNISKISRRTFVGVSSLAAMHASNKLAAQSNIAAPPVSKPPIIVTSWEFGSDANAKAWPILEQGGLAIDSVEMAINYVENLPDEYWVGFGGVPNEVDETTLDAMMMWEPTHDVGAVGCMKRIKPAISVARKVMEQTQHSLIVGDDATRFAIRMGFTETSLTNVRSQTAWEKWKEKGEPSDAFAPEPIAGGPQPQGHDTVGTMAIDQNGNICVGCSTNGREFKIPGRVGDSPIAGAGTYCDNDTGAAIATGNGDVMMRFLPTYHAIEMMRTGASPRQAAKAALKRITDKGYSLNGGIIVLAKNGQHGAAKSGWNDTNFRYATHNINGPTLHKIIA